MKNSLSVATHFDLTCTRWTCVRHQAILGWCHNCTLNSHVIKMKSLVTASISYSNAYKRFYLRSVPSHCNPPSWISVCGGSIYIVIRYVTVYVCMYVLMLSSYMSIFSPVTLSDVTYWHRWQLCIQNSAICSTKTFIVITEKGRAI
jgi:hypothetical protein